ncbi:MAG: serine/threonine-protein phosphatase, partial [Candidatus Aminicenantes bacterium]|nr:serine/threonine-protein phosphatase [Candidatus Aminicenantes bacterium]
NGDIFDYLPVSDRVMGIAIADSSGHGLPSALLARDVVTGLRMGADTLLPLAALIERLNRVIHRAALATKFISLFYGELAVDGKFSYCNAGHNLPLLLRDSSFLTLSKRGMVLGLLPAARYQSASINLLPGDLLLLYTDGVTERENDEGEMFGNERLEAVLMEHRAGEAHEIVTAVFRAVDLYGRGTPAADDMTVLALRRL